MNDYQPSPSDTTPTGKMLNALARAGRRIVKSGPDKYMAQCPGPGHAHGDRRPSLSIGVGENGGCVMRCMSAGCATSAIVQAVGITLADLMPERPARMPQRKPPARSGKVFATLDDAVRAVAWQVAKAQELPADRVTVAGTWTYRDAGGEPVAVVVRVNLPTVDDAGKTEKEFRPLHRVAGGWRLGDPPAGWPLYGRPALTGAGRVYVVEGEKAADAAAACGLVATTSAHGAQSPHKTDWTPLASAGEVVILPDNDPAGQGYAQRVGGILRGLDPAPVVKVLDLPDLPPKGDFYDFSADCRDGQDAESIRGEVDALADAAPVWTGEPAPAPGADAAPEPVAVLVRLADVAPVAVRWLWPGRIAIGKVTMFAGDPGLGKSFLTLDMAARVSTGRPWPDCPTVPNPAGGVTLLNCEDDLADTIRPRLDRAGADCSRIIALQGVGIPAGQDGQMTERSFSLDRDLPRLEVAIAAAPGCRLVIIDPITAYLGATDSHKNADIRALLSPLGTLAARVGVAIVCVSHLNKGQGPAMYRTMGSLAFVAAARAAWAVTKDKDDPTGTRRLVLPVKNNIGPDNSGLAYALVDGSVRWEPDPVSITADEALAPDMGGGDAQDDTELARATEWLREALAHGYLPGLEVQRQARECGISKRTLDRAKRDAAVDAFRPVVPGPWYWRLPGQEHPAPTIPPDVGNLGDVGNVAVNTGVSGGMAPQGCQGCQSGTGGDVGPVADADLPEVEDADWFHAKPRSTRAGGQRGPQDPSQRTPNTDRGAA